MSKLSYRNFELYYKIKPYVDKIDKRKLQLDLAYATKHPDSIDISNSNCNNNGTVTLKAYLLNGLEIELVTYTTEDRGKSVDSLDNHKVHEFKDYRYSKDPVTDELTELLRFYANWVIPTFSSNVIHFGTITLKSKVEDGTPYSILLEYLDKNIVN